jgi:hypothetical protein
MSMYGKVVCTIYEAKNGYMLEFTEPAETGKKGEAAMPAETEHVLAKSVADVVRLVKQELGEGPDDSEAKEYAEGFKDATASDTKKPAAK